MILLGLNFKGIRVNRIKFSICNFMMFHQQYCTLIGNISLKRRENDSLHQITRCTVYRLITEKFRYFASNMKG